MKRKHRYESRVKDGRRLPVAAKFHLGAKCSAGGSEKKVCQNVILTKGSR